MVHRVHLQVFPFLQVAGKPGHWRHLEGSWGGASCIPRRPLAILASLGYNYHETCAPGRWTINIHREFHLFVRAIVAKRLAACPLDQSQIGGAWVQKTICERACLEVECMGGVYHPFFGSFGVSFGV